MNSLIAEHLQLGITTTTELSDFHLQFSTITSWLISNGQLSKIEQKRAYIQAFQPQFLTAILNRLQLQHIDHHPSIPYPIKDVYDSALYVLRSSFSAPQNYFAPSVIMNSTPVTTSATSATPVSAPEIQHKDIKAIFSEFTKTVISAIQATNQHRSHTHSNIGQRNFCSQDQLPSTSPRHTIRKDDSQVQKSKNDRTSTSVVRFLPQLLKEDWIASLEAEILALRTRKSAIGPIVQNRVSASTDTCLRLSQQNPAIQTVVTTNATEVQPRTPDTVHISTSQPTSASEHLFYQTTIVDNRVPNQQNIAALFKTFEPIQYPHPVPKPINPISAPKNAVKVPQQLVEKSSTLIQQELLLTAPETPSKPCLDNHSPRPPHQDLSSATQKKSPASNLDNSDLKLDYLPLVPDITKPRENRHIPLDTSKEEYSIAETVLLCPKNLSFPFSPSDSVPASTTLSIAPEVLQTHRTTLDSTPSSIPPSDIAACTTSNIVIPLSPISSPATSFLVSRSTSSHTAPEPIEHRIRHLSASISTDYTSSNAPNLRQNQTSQFQPPASTFIIYNFVPPLRRLTTRHKDSSNIPINHLYHGPVIDPEPPPFSGL